MNKFISKVLLIVVIFNALMFNNCFAYDNIDRYSKGSILIDQLTGRVLYEKNPDKKMPLASLSKMMTFLIAIESIQNGSEKKEDLVEIDEDVAKVRGSSYKLKEGEKVPLIELMKGLMIVSGNDAAVAIAKHISGNVDDFVKLMNDKAAKLGMNNTLFINPNGLPVYSLQNPKDPPKENISTPRDIAILGKYMFDNYEKEVVSITDMQIYSYPERNFCKNNTNVLLQLIPSVDGIKTGYTGNAGYCLCFSMKIDKEQNKNDIENRFIGVVLGTNHKDKRTKSAVSLLNYGKENFNTKVLFEEEDLLGKKYIYGLDELEISLNIKDDLYIVARKDEKIKSEVTLKEIDHKVKKGDTIGVIKYYDSFGKELGRTNIVSGNDLGEISLKTRIKIMLK